MKVFFGVCFGCVGGGTPRSAASVLASSHGRSQRACSAVQEKSNLHANEMSDLVTRFSKIVFSLYIQTLMLVCAMSVFTHFERMR